jgi:two-component system CheB/CheR fusion protein
LRYRRLFESAQDAILILDFDTGKILDVNPYLMDMLGYSHEEFLEKYLWEVSPFKDTALNKETFAKLQREGYVRYEDLPLETSDGRSISVEFVSNSYPVSGKTFIQCNIRDITERKNIQKKAEQALKESEKRYRTLFEESKDGVYSVLRDGEITDANPSFRELFGYTREEMIGKDIRELYYDPTDRLKFQEEIEKK